ncbi:MAG: hypothetical protein ACRDV7_14790, partial [Acidimicrobiia bacterium]
ETLRVGAVERWGHVVLVRRSGTAIDGATFENPCAAVSTWDNKGLVTHIAVYDPDDLDAAVARLQELTP